MAELNDLEQNDVLEFEDDSLPELPDDNPFDDTKSKKTWLYAGIGLVAVTLVIVVVLKLVTGGKSVEPGLIEIPIERGIGTSADHNGDDFIAGADKIVAGDKDKPLGMPERVVENRKDVTFDPDKPTVQRPKPRPVGGVSKPEPSKPMQNTGAKASGWHVQVGSYPTRAAAEKGQKQLQAAHRNLFSGHDFSILSAVLPNGQTTYRLRVVGFKDVNSANGFLRNAKSDGVDGYVTK